MKVAMSLRVALDCGGTVDVSITGYERGVDTDDDTLVTRLFEALVERLGYEE